MSAVSWFTVPTPLPSGPVRVGVTADGVVAADFLAAQAAPAAAQGGGPDVVRPGDEAKAALVAERFAEYFAGRRRDLELPVDWSPTSGPQRAVLQTLHRTVGFGETVTYGELATRSGVFEDDPALRGQAARAVGSIMGSCPVFLLVPCHRVIAKTGGGEASREGVVVGRRVGGLGGFGGGELGMEVKRWLLTLEGVLAPRLDWNGPGRLSRRRRRSWLRAPPPPAAASRPPLCGPRCRAG